MFVFVDHRNVKAVEVSALGKKVTTHDYKIETEVLCHKGQGQFDLRLEKSSRRLVTEEEAEEMEVSANTMGDLGSDQGRAEELEGQSLTFGLTEHGWRARHEGGAVDFKEAVWADSIEGFVPSLIVEVGAHPRVQWFSSLRAWKKGDRITLTGSALKILDPFDVSGRVELKFEGVEAVGGHPCGVFSVAGNLRAKDQVQFDGSLRDTEMSITSGRIWASLLHPILLREEYDTIQTMVRREGKRGGPETRMQGGIHVRKCRNWSPAGE